MLLQTLGGDGMTREEGAIEYFIYCLTELKMDTDAIREAYEMAIEALQQTGDKECSRCINRGKCAIYDNFNIDYCSDWRPE